MIQVDNLTYTYAGEQAPALKDISFRVEAGECVCFTGHSGCGKTTLLLALKDLLHEGVLNGSVTFGDGTASREEVLSLAGLVFQNAESQLLCATAFD